MDLDAFEIDQNGKKLYVTTMTVRDLRDEDRVRVDEWSRDNPNGYQRKPTDSRVKAFGRFIGRAKGVSPLSLTLSVRGKVVFSPKNGNFGSLRLPEDNVLWVVDGQHRIAGLRHVVENENPDYDDFPLPVVIMPTDSEDGHSSHNPRFEEAKQFVIINRTAKGVRSDLAERFLNTLKKTEGPSVIADLPSQVTRGIDWVPKATDIVDELNKNGVWASKIRLPNEGRAGTIVNQKSFTDSLKPILTNETFSAYSAEELAKLLNMYWEAIEEVCSEAFEDPANHVIQKTVGVFVLHRLLGDVLAYAAKQDGSVSKDRIISVLRKVDREFSSDYWNASAGDAGLIGTSQKAFSIVYSTIKDALDAANSRSTALRTYKIS